MLFKVLAIGRIKDPAIRSRCAEFAKWLGPYAKIEICELPDSDMAGEGAAFARALERDRGAALVVLSEEGKEFTSVEFARKLGSFDRKVVFVIGGPCGDSGLTGRKIIVDTYGGMAAHGGGAFSGKDPSKVDRSAAYYARYAAKNIVAAGLADRCQIQVAYAIGLDRPVSFCVKTFGTAKGNVTDEALEKMLVAGKVFDFRPAALIDDLQLLKPRGWSYEDTASYGHFGRDIFPWEKLDRVPALKMLFKVA